MFTFSAVIYDGNKQSLVMGAMYASGRIKSLANER